MPYAFDIFTLSYSEDGTRHAPKYHENSKIKTGRLHTYCKPSNNLLWDWTLQWVCCSTVSHQLHSLGENTRLFSVFSGAGVNGAFLRRLCQPVIGAT